MFISFTLPHITIEYCVQNNTRSFFKDMHNTNQIAKKLFQTELVTICYSIPEELMRMIQQHRE